MSRIVFLVLFQLSGGIRNYLMRCINTHPNPNFEASQYTSKSSVPSGNAKIGALVNLCFNILKAYSCLGPHSNLTALQVSLVKGTAILEKSLINRL
ncbi:hypothetical protein Hanom_Chr12g01073871 [Helianthus anomalus]